MNYNQAHLNFRRLLTQDTLRQPQGRLELLMHRTVLRRIQEAISYECWTELDFNNELKGDR